MAQIKFRRPLLMPPMDFATLKVKTRELWNELHKINECIPAQSFEAEIQHYGNLADETTWRDAYAALKAQFLANCLEDPQYLIEFYLLYSSKHWDWRELLPRVIDQLCLIPEGLQALIDGIHAIQQYGCEYGANLNEVNQVGGFIHVAAERQRLELGPEQRAILTGSSS